jgi:hypothetical protein
MAEGAKSFMGNLMGQVTGLESTLTQKTENAKGVFAGFTEKASGVGANFTSGLSAFKDKVSGSAAAPAEAAVPAAGGRGRRTGKSKRSRTKRSRTNKSKKNKSKSKKNKKKRVRFSRRTRSRHY